MVQSLHVTKPSRKYKTSFEPVPNRFDIAEILRSINYAGTMWFSSDKTASKSSVEVT